MHAIRSITHVIILPFFAAMLLLAPLSCGDDESGETWTNVSKSNTYSVPGDQVFLVDTTGNVNLTYTLDLGAETRDVYFIFSNTTMSDAGSNPVVKSMGEEDPIPSDVIISDELVSTSIVELHDADTSPQGQRGTPEISNFNNSPLPQEDEKTDPILHYSLTVPIPMMDTESQAKNFYDDIGGIIPATCRKIVNSGSGIPVTLNIWVADNCWNPCSKAKCVTTAMVDALANKFIQSNSNNDIYEWTTHIFGPEWESTAHSLYSYLIPDTNEITILLYDIGSDNSTNGGVTGFFYARDNFYKNELDPRLKYSNERIMFYLDAVLFATGVVTWEITDYWPSEIISTLSHEFQHMIHFYQKNILRSNGNESETWLNELCSLVTEDLMSSKAGVPGPRGVDYTDGSSGNINNTKGRLPEYIYYNNISLTSWDNLTKNYSINYAFGAYLARNYGGASFIRNLMLNSYTDYNAINFALQQGGYSNEDFSTVLRKWAAANILSDSINPPDGKYQYNSGTWFNSKILDSDPIEMQYQLGSINLYNYKYSLQVGPHIYSSIPTGTQDKTSNIYLLVGTNLTGTITRSVTMEDNIKLTVVVKE